MSSLSQNINESVAAAVKPLASRLGDMQLILAAVVLVLMVALGGLLVNVMAERKAAFLEINSQIASQGAKIEILTNEIKDLRDFSQKCNALIKIGC